MEWTIDRFINEYQFLSPTDPVNLDTGSGRTARGGFWASLPKDCRSARRLSIPPDSAEPTIGFRLVRTIPQD